MKPRCKIFWLDVETTGLEPDKNDITELAAMVEDNGKIIKYLTLHLKPTSTKIRYISKVALDLQGIDFEELKSPDRLSQAEGFDALIRTLDSYVDRYDKRDKMILAGYFVGFDMSFLREMFKSNGNNYYGSYFIPPVIDVSCTVAEWVSRNGMLENYKLATICKNLGITLDEVHDAHDAMNDIFATRECYYRLLTARFKEGQRGE